MSDFQEIQDRMVRWHEKRFPNAQMEHVCLKLCEEAGEVARAINGTVGANSATGGGNVGEEAADVIISLLVLLGRWFPDTYIYEEVMVKLIQLETPGMHKASAQL